MGVSEERIDELIEEMLNNADENGWCYLPKDLSEEEESELSNRLTVITMQDRIDTLLEGILNVFKWTENIKEHIDSYDTVDKLRIKGSLLVVKEDSQGLLMDIHSNDRVTDFFRFDMVPNGDGSKEDVKKAKTEMEVIIDGQFKEQLAKIKEYCIAMIEMSDDIVEKLSEK